MHLRLAGGGFHVPRLLPEFLPPVEEPPLREELFKRQSELAIMILL